MSVELALSVISETNTTRTLGWEPVAGAVGFRFTVDGKVSHTWDGSRSSVKVARSASAVKVEALAVTAEGVWPPPVVAGRPFDPAHPMYQPIPDGCPLYEHSAAVVARVKEHGAFFLDVGTNSPGVYRAVSSDPVWTIVSGGRTFQVRAPDTIKAGTGSDAPLVVVEDSTAFSSSPQPTEWRMWRAVIDRSARRITVSGLGVGNTRNDGVILAGQTVQSGRVARALGQAEMFGQNTGSGCSYTVGMIRGDEVADGRIDHAIRVAAKWVHGASWFWPALRTETEFPTDAAACPMGARVFLDPSVDVAAVGDAAAAGVSDARSKRFVRMFVTALQEFGMCPLDGSGGCTVYFDAAADWATLIGPRNSYGSYNDLARAIAVALPWDMLRVAHQGVR